MWLLQKQVCWCLGHGGNRTSSPRSASRVLQFAYVLPCSWVHFVGVFLRGTLLWLSRQNNALLSLWLCSVMQLETWQTRNGHVDELIPPARGSAAFDRTHSAVLICSSPSDCLENSVFSISTRGVAGNDVVFRFSCSTRYEQKYCLLLRQAASSPGASMKRARAYAQQRPVPNVRT